MEELFLIDSNMEVLKHTFNWSLDMGTKILYMPEGIPDKMHAVLMIYVQERQGKGGALKNHG